MNERCVFWSRVSALTIDPDCVSLDHQRAVFLDWATKRNGTVVKEYMVAETASVKEERKLFQEMMDFIRANHKSIDVLLVYSFDRVARNFFDWAELDRLEADCAIRIIPTTQPAPSASAENMLRRIIGAIVSFNARENERDEQFEKELQDQMED